MSKATAGIKNWIGLAAVGLATLLTAGVAAASAPITVTFNGGGLTNLSVDDAFTQASFEDLTFHYEACGTDPAELTCTWKVSASLSSDPARRCNPSTPESQPIWDSGEQSGSGSVSSGSRSFALEGCRGQVLSAFYETKKTFDPSLQDGPWKVLISGGRASLLQITIGGETVKEAEEKIRNASPPAHPAAPPTPPSLAVSPSCRQLKIDGNRYAFVFHLIGCHKATNLVARAAFGDSAPNGYACKAQRGGKRCWRRGHPEKYFEWHRVNSA